MKVVISLLVILAIAFVSSVPQKPLWPVEFDSPFGLYVPANGTDQQEVINATSHFYYNYNIGASVIDYPERCIPLGFVFSDYLHCRWYFNQKGAYLYIPTPIPELPTCCLVFPGVGSVPPNFLAGFDYSMQTIGLDYYGNPHYSNLWIGDGHGAGGFQYWTDVETGFDVAFVDGGRVMWTWGEFNVVNQSASIFNIPDNCLQSCDLELDQVGDPLFKLMMHNYKKNVW